MEVLAHKQRDTAKLHGEKKNEVWNVEQTTAASLEFMPRRQSEAIVRNSTHPTGISSNVRTKGWRSTMPQPPNFNRRTTMPRGG